MSKCKNNKIVYKEDVTKRKMGEDELRVYLREKKRGCGIHGLKSNKSERRKFKQKQRGFDYE